MPEPSNARYGIDDTRVVGATPWLETSLDHPEDVAVADDGTLFAGGEAGQLYHVQPDPLEITELASTGGSVVGVELGPDGDLYACDFQQHIVVRLPLDGTERGGPLETVASGGPDQPPWQPNYCLFDREGRLYVSDSGDRTAPMAESGGCVYVIEPDGSGRVLTDEPSAFTNGLALSTDERRLYVAETGGRRVSVVHLDDGVATGVDAVTDEFGLVDGLALDADDDLYAASIGDDAVYRLRDGAVEPLLVDPDGLTLGNPTNLAFGGPEMRTIYVPNLGLRHITALEIDATGRMPTARL